MIIHTVDIWHGDEVIYGETHILYFNKCTVIEIIPKIRNEVLQFSKWFDYFLANTFEESFVDLIKFKIWKVVGVVRKVNLIKNLVITPYTIPSL